MMQVFIVIVNLTMTAAVVIILVMQYLLLDLIIGNLPQDSETKLDIREYS